jgi:hypothetical protein
MAAGNKIPKITDFDTLEAYVDATLAMDGPPKSMGKVGPGMRKSPKIPQKVGPGMRKSRKTPQKGLNND